MMFDPIATHFDGMAQLSYVPQQGGDIGHVRWLCRSMAQTLGVFIRVFLVSGLKAALLSRFLVPLFAPDFRPVGSPQRVRNAQVLNQRLLV